MKELEVYSTVAGELVKLVENKIPKCFVPYEQVKELLDEYNELKFRMEQLEK